MDVKETRHIDAKTEQCIEIYWT